jgi:hypothetical protein
LDIQQECLIARQRQYSALSVPGYMGLFANSRTGSGSPLLTKYMRLFLIIRVAVERPEEDRECEGLSWFGSPSTTGGLRSVVSLTEQRAKDAKPYYLTFFSFPSKMSSYVNYT